MESHFVISDTFFEQTFKNQSLDPSCFTHEAHLRLAWIHIRKYRKEQAILNISEQLLNFVAFLGDEEKYNKTLTVAAIEIVVHFIQKSNADTFQDFINEFPRLNTHFRKLVESHYKMDIFSSLEAKRRYLKPDLCDF